MRTMKRVFTVIGIVILLLFVGYLVYTAKVIT